jgi:hypothetical protein
MVRIKRRVLAIVMVVTLILGLLPVSALAGDSETISLKVGETASLPDLGDLPDNGAWSVKAEDIAVVEGSVIKGVGVGTTTLVYTYTPAVQEPLMAPVQNVLTPPVEVPPLVEPPIEEPPVEEPPAEEPPAEEIPADGTPVDETQTDGTLRMVPRPMVPRLTGPRPTEP